MANKQPQVFLLSPAHAGGDRAKLLFNPRAQFDLALRLRQQGAQLGEIYSFISGLYFRGKLAYSAAFASPPRKAPGRLVITPGRGLASPETLVTVDELNAIAAVPIEKNEARYIDPLSRDAELLNEIAGPGSRLVLLGSIATPKYIEPLLAQFGERLVFPIDFVGRGDMSRGGLMLRAARAGIELRYVPVEGAIRHGPRPPKLPRLPRRNP